tara:strand:+ start:9070 stop:9495 length:426 start_codon:yes stop_codon:yes gene_type:complete
LNGNKGKRKTKVKKSSQKKKTIFRSKFEEEVITSIKQKGWKYEPKKFFVYIPTSYTPDLILPNGIYVELKGFLRAEARRKYENFKKQNPNIDLRFVFANIKQTYQGSTRTNQQWAEKHGFIYANKRIPTSWFSEPKKEEAN